ncbi:hypothetical protein PSECIP111854_00017 [Pseudoalteromonas sp. CIP111854]|uniref:Uncharacterized protein n=1 Tax=Pseudoalteromonas holothuriae TaxID=2963714 RepID=A0A9W4QQK1_9GAMM|nr:hypothetical protein PSECIP111854_00017 [Pseudoalteromonas sp. CIP111854]
MHKKSNIFGTIASFTTIVVVLLFAASSCTNPSTPAGHEGYIYEQPRFIGSGGYQGSLVGPSNYGFSLLRNQVVNIDMRPNTYTERFSILANDDLNISFDFHAVLAIKQVLSNKS